MLSAFWDGVQVLLDSALLTPFFFERRAKQKNASPVRKSKPAIDTPTPRPACAPVLKLDADAAGAGEVVTGAVAAGTKVGMELVLRLAVGIEVENVERSVVDAEPKRSSGASAWKVSLLGTLQSSSPEP